MAKREKRSGNEDFLTKVRNRLRVSMAAETRIREEALRDMKFYSGDQWDANIKAKREREGRPCLTINRMRQFINLVSNEIRQAHRAVKVSPVDDRADVETADVLQGIVRHIEQNSDAAIAYETAGGHVVKIGFGWILLTNKFADYTTFDQEISIEPVWDAFTTYLDPMAKLPCGEGARYGFIIRNFSVDDYREQFDKSEVAGWPDIIGQGTKTPGWFGQDFVRVVDYYELQSTAKKLLQLSSGTTLFEPDLAALMAAAEATGQAAPTVTRERMVDVPVVKRFTLNAVETLEETVWPGDEIPIVRILGDAEIVDGELKILGLIHDAIDSQRMYNYMASAEAEAIALAPKAPFVIAEGQISGHEKEWTEANLRSSGALVYKVQDVDGRPVGPPQRQQAEPAIQAISHARLMSAEDVKATIGLYDPSLGARSNESSGIAIQSRQQQGNTVTYHFGDNVSRAIRVIGRQLVTAIPRVYDRPGRVQRILGEDDTSKLVTLNKVFKKNGQDQIYALGVGRYDVAVTVGGSFATKRQEAVASMVDTMRVYPAIAQVAGDLIVRNMDWPGAAEIADRLKKVLPPELQDKEQDQNAPPIPPQVQAQVQQLVQQVEQLAQALDQATQTINQKQVEAEAKVTAERDRLASQERIAAADRQVKVRLETLHVQAQLLQSQATLASKEDTAHLKAQMEILLRQIDLVLKREDSEKSAKLSV